jgi:hypothetical protein
MAAKIIPIGYREVEIYEGSENKLINETTFYAYFDRIYFFAILFGLLFAGYALFAYNIFVNPIWDILFTVILFVAIILLFFAGKREKTFAKISHIKHFTFDVDKVDVTDNGEMFVDAYAITDYMRQYMYRFKFDEMIDFENGIFTLYQVNLNGYKTLHYCRKKVK